MRFAGIIRRGIFLAIGFIYAIPVLTWQILYFALAPRRYLKRRNYSAMEPPPLLPNLHHEMVDVGNGVSIHTVRTFQGNPTKPVLVLVHGFPDWWGCWHRQIKYFRDEFDVVAMSLRGYSLSSKPQGYKDYIAEILINDLYTVIKSLGVEQVILVGHDWGGGLCWLTAMFHPEVISKLVIACAPHPKLMRKNMDWKQFFSSWYMYFFQIPFLPEMMFAAEDYKIVDQMLLEPPMGLQRPGIVTQEYFDAYKKEIARPGALKASINYYRAMMLETAYGVGDEETRAVMNRPVQVPTLVIWADLDVALGMQLLKGIEKYVKSVRVEVLKNCSHWAQQDSPEEFNALMEDFLRPGGSEN
jgi:pimeloyl-ACP methyl ester carboxylesterase